MRNWEDVAGPNDEEEEENLPRSPFRVRFDSYLRVMAGRASA